MVVVWFLVFFVRLTDLLEVVTIFADVTKIVARFGVARFIDVAEVIARFVDVAEFAATCSEVHATYAFLMLTWQDLLQRTLKFVRLD